MTILKFGASWCSGCLIMKPRWAKIEEAYRQHGITWTSHFFDFDDTSSDTQQALLKYNIQNNKGVLPVFVWLDENNNETERLSGEVSEEKLVKTINSQLTKEGLTPPEFAKPTGILSWISTLFS